MQPFLNLLKFEEKVVNFCSENADNFNALRSPKKP